MSVWLTAGGSASPLACSIMALPELCVLAAAFVAVQAGLTCLKPADLGRKVASCFSDVRAASLVWRAVPGMPLSAQWKDWNHLFQHEPVHGSSS